MLVKEMHAIVDKYMGTFGIRSLGFTHESNVVDVYYHGDRCPELEALLRRALHPVEIAFKVLGRLPTIFD